MKILHVIDSINGVQGGPSVSVPALAGAQAKLGHQVTIACRDYGYLGPMVRAGGAEIKSVPSSRWTKGQGGWGCAFRRLVEEEARKADVVHNHGLWLAANYCARRAANKAGKPLVVSTRGMLEDWSLGRSKMKKRVAWMLFERENLRSAKLFHATAESEAQSIQAALGKLAGGGRREVEGRLVEGGRQEVEGDRQVRIVVAPNGVDVPERIPGREVVEQKFPKLKGKEWVLFMSRIHPKKGLDLLLQAWKEQMSASGQVEGGRWKEGQGLQATGYRNDPSSISQTPSATRTTVLVIAGADTQGYGKEVERMIREKKLGETVLMTGHADGQIREALLGNAKFFVLPSYSENFGLVVAESLARGRPVITTTGTPWKELTDWGAGWWVEPRQKSVTQAMGEALTKTDAELDQMGARGRKMVGERFSWKSSAERLVAAYKEIGNFD